MKESEKSGLKLNIQKIKIMSSLNGLIDVQKLETVIDFIFGAPKSLWTVTAAINLNFTWKESYDKPRQHIKKQRHHFAH